MMVYTLNANELKTLADVAVTEELLDHARPAADGHVAEQEEADDGVEALIVFMDATTLEHIFLQAQRQMQREAAEALNGEGR